MGPESPYSALYAEGGLCSKYQFQPFDCFDTDHECCGQHWRSALCIFQLFRYTTSVLSTQCDRRKLLMTLSARRRSQHLTVTVADNKASHRLSYNWLRQLLAWSAARFPCDSSVVCCTVYILDTFEVYQKDTRKSRWNIKASEMPMSRPRLPRADLVWWGVCVKIECILCKMFYYK